jgi:hypothetical protein
VIVMTPQQVLHEINTSIRLAIEAGLSDQQKYPVLKRVGRRDFDIHIESSPDLSISLRDKTYDEIYAYLEASGAFNLKMIDGALIQMLYTFRDDEVASHRLCVFPSPKLDTYEDARDAYEADELYADIVARNVVRFPLRFDFSSDTTRWVDCDHAMSHLTLGQYTNCRIPVAAPLTPTKFMRFIIRSFYNSAVQRFKFGAESIAYSFPETISDNERQIGYLTL